jgi:hypothetical protein
MILAKPNLDGENLANVATICNMFHVEHWLGLIFRGMFHVEHTGSPHRQFSEPFFPSSVPYAVLEALAR